jgi:hypothetical protein
MTLGLESFLSVFSDPLSTDISILNAKKRMKLKNSIKICNRLNYLSLQFLNVLVYSSQTHENMYKKIEFLSQ